MKKSLMKTVIVLPLLIHALAGAAAAEEIRGTVDLDFPSGARAEFRFDLDRRVIALVMEDPSAQISPLFRRVDTLHLRGYSIGAGRLKATSEHYGKRLTASGWHTLRGFDSEDRTEKAGDWHLYALRIDDTVYGVLAIVKSESTLYLINIACEIPKHQLRELLRNLHQLGIELPELRALKSNDLDWTVPAVPPPIEMPDKRPPIDAEEEESQRTTHPQNWHVDGKPIHEFLIVNALSTPASDTPHRAVETHAAEETTILKILRSGSGDITQALPIIASILLKRSRKVTLRIEEAEAKRKAILTIDALPVIRTLSILKSLTLSGPRGTELHKSTLELSLPEELAAQASKGSTRFRAGDVGIHEIQIRGNRKIPETDIYRTLENGSEDIEQALQTLFKVMPYFKEIRLQVDRAEEAPHYIATLTVHEKPLSTDVYLGLSPPLRLGFNRVTGWELGTGVELGRRKTIGPLWMWNVRDGSRTQTSKLFGQASYAFGNPHLQYRIGGTAHTGTPYVWSLGLTAQMHRLTAPVAPHLFPDTNNGFRVFERVIGIPDLPNYYLRQGAAVIFDWTPVMPTHAFKVAAVTESHTNLEKSTDWFVANWGSGLTLRENPPINAAQLRSVTFRYDFSHGTRLLGWRNSLLIEYSPMAAGSDFTFTRLLLHLRYAFRLANNRFRTRFLFGFSDSILPLQRQFVISGIEGLRGYPWYSTDTASEGTVTYNSAHTTSPYAFTGDRGFLLNVEYHHRLSNLINWGFFRNAFVIVFFDEGQVWSVAGPAYTFDPKGNAGIGLQFGEGEVMFRVNIAKPFESGTPFQVTTVWQNSF